MFEKLWMDILLFLGCGAAIAFVGTMMTAWADELADATGLGEAFMGAVFLGACTSLPGITASITAAVDGHPVLSLSNALGGIAVQTLFLVAGDLAYRKANLEHAAASIENMMQSALLVILMGLTALAMVGPQLTIGHINVLTPVLFLTYAFGQRLVFQARQDPMWTPRFTKQTEIDEPEERQQSKRAVKMLWAKFAAAAVVVVATGWMLTRSAESIASRTGLSDSLIGSLGTAVVTSLPELVTCVVAVRRGALTLAVGDIIGGNAFDTLFAAVADLFYFGGSIYQAATSRELWLVALTIVMTAVLLLGLIRREKSGIGNIGFESFAVIMLYVFGMGMLVFGNMP